MNNELRDQVRDDLRNWMSDALIRTARTQAELAEACGVSRQAVGNWLREGKITRPKLRLAEEFLGEYSPTSLRAQAPLKVYQLGDSMNIQRPALLAKAVPILTWGEISKINFDSDDRVITGKEEVICPVAHSVKTYGLKIKGRAMSTMFNDGDIIFVDAERTPSNGDYVVVQLEGDDEAICRQYNKEGGISTLTVSNPSWPKQVIECQEDPEIIAVVIGKFTAF